MHENVGLSRTRVLNRNQRGGWLRIALSVVLSVMMTVQGVPAPALAEAMNEATATPVAQVVDEAGSEEDILTVDEEEEQPVPEERLADVLTPADPDEGQPSAPLAPTEGLGPTDQQPAEELQPAAFYQSASLEADGVTVYVEAEADAFPEGATLKVEKADLTDAQQAAIDTARATDQNVAKSYSLAVKVVAADGTELQPAEGKKVDVRVATPEAASENLAASVWRHAQVKDEKTGEVRDVAEAANATKAIYDNAERGVHADVVSAEAGLSTFTLDFTYGQKRYELQGVDAVQLAVILESVGLKGEVAEAKAVAPKLVSVEQRDGTWVVAALEAFRAEQTLIVRIGGVDYQISLAYKAPGADAGEQERTTGETPAATPAFSQSATVDGTVVTVEAEEGTFPEGATISVQKAELTADEQAAVDAERSDGRNVAKSYTFDIAVLDAEGNEVQPAEGKKVNVSFALAEAGNDNLEAAVFHLDEEAGAAEALATTEEVVEGTEVVSAETAGFSRYTVEFTYGEKQYVLQGDESVELSAILEAVGLTGEVQDAVSDAPELFSVSNESGAWMVTAKQAFHTEQKLTVTLRSGEAELEYVITVTDENTNTVKALVHNNSDQQITIVYSYNYDQNLGTTSNTVVPANETVNLSANGFLVPEGAVFAGWVPDLNKSQDGVQYTSVYGDDSPLTLTVSESTTLYALWDFTPEEYRSAGYYNLFTSSKYGNTLVSLSGIGSGSLTVAGNYFSSFEDAPAKIYIPGAFGGENITKIGNGAFKAASSKLTQIAFDPNMLLVNIDDNAFRANSLADCDLILPKSVQRIGNSAFDGESEVNCSGPKSCNFTELVDLQTIGQLAFYGHKFSSIDLSKNEKILSIPTQAFRGNSCSVVLPPYVKSLYESAFTGLNGKVVIPSSVEHWDNQFGWPGKDPWVDMSQLTPAQAESIYLNLAFFDSRMWFTLTWPTEMEHGDFIFDKETGTIYGISSQFTGGTLTVPVEIDGVTVQKLATSCFEFKPENGSRPSSIVIEEGTVITEIPKDMCKWNSGLTSVTLPEGITTIGFGAFNGTGLTSIDLPDSVTTICGNNDINDWTGAFYGAKISDVKLSDNVTSIGNYAFYSDSLKTVTIGTESGSKATSIADKAFGEASTTDIYIPGIEKDASLTGVAPWSTAPWAAYNATIHWKSSEEEDITTDPTSVKVIDINGGVWLFNSLNGELLYWEGYEPGYDGNWDVHSADNGINLTIPSLVYEYESYKTNPSGTPAMEVKSFAQRFLTAADQTKNYYIDTLVWPASAPAMPRGDYTTQNHSHLGSTSNLYINKLVIGDGITSIPDNFANRLAHLGEVTIPRSVTSIGRGAFYLCSELILTNPLHNGLTSIDGEAFHDCSKLTSKWTDSAVIVIPDSVTTMSSSPFDDATLRNVGEVRVTKYLGGTENVPYGALTCPDSWGSFGTKWTFLKTLSATVETVGQVNDVTNDEAKVYIRALKKSGTDPVVKVTNFIPSSMQDGLVNVETLSTQPDDFPTGAFWDDSYVYARVTMSKNGTYYVNMQLTKNDINVPDEVVPVAMEVAFGIVRYNLGGGVGSLPDPAEKEYMEGKPVIIGDPSSLSMEAYKNPSKWNTKEDGTGTDYTTGSTYTVVKNVTLDLYPVWEVDESQKVNVIFKAANHGSVQGAGEDGTVTVQIVKAKSVTPTLGDHISVPDKGYTSIGWYVNGAQKSNTAAIDNSTAAGAILSRGKLWLKTTFLAGFTPNKYTIKFEKNRGDASGSMNSIETQYDRKETAPDCGFTSATAAFIGWNTAADGTGTMYNAGDDITNIAGDTTENSSITLYAQWKTAVEVRLTGNSTEKTYNGEEQTFGDYKATYWVGGVEQNLPEGFTVSFSATQSGEANEGVYVKGKDAGPYTATVTATLSGDAEGYAIKNQTVTATLSLKINPRPITVRADSKSKIYGQADPALTTTVTGAIESDGITISAWRETGNDVGTYSIHPDTDKFDNGNYTLTPSDGTFTITKREVTLTADSKDKKYGESDPATWTVTATAATDTTGLANGEEVKDLKYTIRRESGSAVGKYAIIITPLENKNYTITPVDGTFEIKGGDVITVTTAPGSATYDGRTHSFTATPSVSSGTTLWYSEDYKPASGGNAEVEGTWSTEKPAYINAGEYTVWVKATNENYADGTPVSATVTIEKKEITITAQDKTMTYGGDVPEWSAKVTDAVNGDEIKYDFARKTTGDTANNADTYADEILIVVKDGTAEGTTDENPNYAITTVAGKLTIKQAKAIVTVENAEMEYTGKADTPADVSYTVDGLVGGDTALSGSVKRATADAEKKDAGDKIALTFDYDKDAAVNKNYDITVKPGKLTITKKDLVLTAGNASVTYGDWTAEGYKWDDHEPTVTPTELVEGDTIDDIYYEVSCRVTAEENPARDAGEYPISIKAPARYTKTTPASDEGGEPTTKEYKNKNYNITTEAGTYTIAPKPVTVTPDAAVTKPEEGKSMVNAKKYGDDDPELSYTVYDADKAKYEPADGLDPVEVTPTRTAGEDVGNYGIVLTKGSNPNYSVTVERGTFTIVADPEKSLGLEVTDYEEPYDGASHTAMVTVDVTQGTKILYSTDYKPAGEGPKTEPEVEGTWSAKAPIVKNVGDDQNGKTFYVKATNKNYADEIKPAKVTVEAAPVTVQADNKSMVYGEDVPELTYTITGVFNNEALYTKDGKEVAPALSHNGTPANKPAATAKTPWTITAAAPKGEDVKQNGNYDVSFTPGKLTVKKAAASEIGLYVEDFEGTYNGSAHGVTVLVDVNEGTTISYSFDDGKTWVKGGEGTTAVPDDAKKTDADTYRVKVKAENPNYGTQFANAKIIIAKRPATLTADNASKTYGEDDPESLSATVTGQVKDGEIGYKVSLVTGENAGAYDINVELDDTVEGNKNGNYDVTLVKGTFTINPKAATVTPKANQKKTYGEDDPASYGATVTGLKEGDELNYKVVREEGENAGSYALSVELGDNPNYDVSTSTGAFVIEPKGVTLTVEDKEKTYGDNDPALTAKPEGLVGKDQLVYELERAGGEDVKADGYEIDAVLDTDGNPNYKVTVEKGTLTIKPKAITVTADNKTKVYGEDDPEFTYTPDGLVGDDTLAEGSVTLTRADGKDVLDADGNVASYAITPAVTEGSNPNYNVTCIPGKLTITKAPLTVTAEDKTATYGEAAPEYSTTYDGFVNSDTEDVMKDKGEPTLTCEYEQGKGAGTYAITPSGLDDKWTNYEIAYKDGTLTVNKKAATLTADDKEKTYGDPDPELTATPGGLVEGDELAYTLSREEGEGVKNGDADSYAIDIALGDNPNYTVTPVAGEFTITPKVVTVKAREAEKTYGGTDPDWTDIKARTTVSGTLNDAHIDFVESDGKVVVSVPIPNSANKYDEFTYTVSRAAGENVGTYDITPAGDEVQGNYKLEFKTAGLTINQKDVVFTADDLSKIYGAADPENLSATVTGTIHDDQVSYEVVSVGESDESDESGEPGEPGDETGDTGEAGDGTAGDEEPANETSQVYEVTATVPGMAEGSDTIVVTVARQLGEAAGQYAIAAVGAEDQGNYRVSFAPGTFTITPREMTITAEGQSKTYGEEDPEASVEATGTLHDDEVAYEIQPLEDGDGYTVTATVAGVEGDDVVVTIVTRAEGEDVGKYAITAAGEREQGNYVVSFNGANLTIDRKPVTVTADDKTKAYTEADPRLTATVEGTIDGDIVDYTIVRDEGEAAGEYAITAAGAANQGNYRVSFEPGTFTITQIANEWTTKPAIEGWVTGDEPSEPQGAAKFGTPEAQYRAKDAGDDAWADEVPTEPGDYEMRLVVPATADYAGLEGDPVAFAIAKVPGNIKKALREGNYGNAKIVTKLADLLGAIDITPEEQALVDAGEQGLIYVVVTDVTDSLDAATKGRLHEPHGKGYTAGTYVDIDLFIKIGDNQPRQITETNDMIDVRLTLPDGLVAENRVFAVSREHDDAVELVDCSISGSNLTLSSERFSNYEIAYAEKAAADAGKTADDAKKSDGTTPASRTTTASTSVTSSSSTPAPKTGDTTTWPFAALAGVAALAVIAAALRKRGRA